jgi:hypothetical protein
LSLKLRLVAGVLEPRDQLASAGLGEWRVDPELGTLVCGAALVAQVRELPETQAIFDDHGYSYLRNMAISWAGGEKEAISLGPSASPVLAAALAWLQSSDPVPTVLAGWRAAARQSGVV